MSQNIQLFHGSAMIVRIPDLSMSCTDLDLGAGFYLSPDYTVATKWASRTNNSICNEYSLNLENLSVYQFRLEREWLDYVVRNRSGQADTPSSFDCYDVLIGINVSAGPEFILELYEDGLITAEETLQSIEQIHHEVQYVLKTPRAIDHLEYITHTEIFGAEQADLRKQYIEDRRDAANCANNLIIEKSK